MRLAWTLSLFASLGILAGCSSLRDEAVPGCPHCGDPLMRVGADGRAEVVPRWRLASWGTPAPRAAAAVGNAPTETPPAPVRWR